MYVIYTQSSKWMMSAIKWSAFVLLLAILSTLHSQTAADVFGDKKLRVCIVESRGTYRKAPKFCPILEATSDLECVIGVDRLDCIRRINKGTAHFGVLSSEELLAARWASLDILVTSEMRSHDTNFEYEIVAVVDNEANIHTARDLRGSKLCHPGYGLGNHWTEVLANYFESTMISKSCNADVSLTEDRISASAKYFGPSCKAGAWVPDPKQDRILKDRYPSLCQLCYDSYRCDVGDKHWGRRGALYCLTNGVGNVAWARLDDVRSHFGLTGLQAEADPSDYSYLCVDGHLQPITTNYPCVWVAKPWPVIAARSSHAVDIQNRVAGLNHDDPKSWQSALLSLLESYHVDIKTLDNVIPIDDYLNQAPAFQSAYSFPECNPPRSIVFCTTSIIEQIKCSWLQEASQIFGIEPNIQCIRLDSIDLCMDDIKFKGSDVVMVDHESRIRAQRDYNLIPIIYEFSQDMHERYAIIAVVHKTSKFKSFTDLEGATACLPSYEGPAHLSVQETIVNITQRMTSLQSFFHRDSCTWHPHAHRSCPDKYRGDEGALRCLAEGGEVAFLSSDIYKNYTVGNLTAKWVREAGHKSFRVICPFGSNERYSKYEYCYMHWTTRGHLMTHNSSMTRINEIYNSLRDIDRLFGKSYRPETRPFTMYGVFDKRNNVLFRDKTDGLRGLADLKADASKRIMEDIFEKYVKNVYVDANASRSLKSSLALIASALLVIKSIWI